MDSGGPGPLQGQSTGSPQDLARLQEALRAFGMGGANAASGLPPSTDLAALVERLGVRAGNGPAADVAPTARGPQSICLLLNGIELAWEAAYVVGVERVVEMTPVPLTKPWVLGVANLRGTITSVVDLRGVLGLPRQAPTNSSRIIVASAHGMTIGFLVDGVAEIRVLLPESIHRDVVRQVAPSWLLPYSDGVVQFFDTERGNRTIIVMAIDRLLSAEALHQYRSDI